jgi:hypothetical protein
MDVSEKISNAIDGINGQSGGSNKLRVKFSKPRCPYISEQIKQEYIRYCELNQQCY